MAGRAVPKQHSTGGKAKLLGITGRKPLTAAEAVRAWSPGGIAAGEALACGGFGQWVHRLAARAPRNKVIVAIANKLAGIAWVVLASGNEYQHQPVAAAGGAWPWKRRFRLESTKRFPLFHRHHEAVRFCKNDFYREVC